MALGAGLGVGLGLPLVIAAVGCSCWLARFGTGVAILGGAGAAAAAARRRGKMVDAWTQAAPETSDVCIGVSGGWVAMASGVTKSPLDSRLSLTSLGSPFGGSNMVSALVLRSATVDPAKPAVTSAGGSTGTGSSDGVPSRVTPNTGGGSSDGGYSGYGPELPAANPNEGDDGEQGANPPRRH